MRRQITPAMNIRASYQILNTPSMSPLGQLLQCVQEPDEATADLILRDPETGQELPTSITRITHIDHDPEEGGIFFIGICDDGRPIQGFVHATPQDDPTVAGSATIIE